MVGIGLREKVPSHRVMEASINKEAVWQEEGGGKGTFHDVKARYIQSLHVRSRDSSRIRVPLQKRGLQVARLRGMKFILTRATGTPITGRGSLVVPNPSLLAFAHALSSV